MQDHKEMRFGRAVSQLPGEELLDIQILEN